MSANIIVEDPVVESESRFGDVVELVNAYFDGLHTGDVDLLASVFDASASLQSEGLRLSRDEWLERVATRTTPVELGDPYRYDILDIDVEGNQGMAKLSVPLLGKTYVDYLSLLKEGGHWQVVNKLYAEA